MLRRIALLSLAFVLTTADQARPATAAPIVACGFRLGFETLHSLIPRVVGDCVESEHADPGTGDALQRTTNGLLAWRKADNWTAFTDGSSTWINGPNGLQSRPNADRFSWESRSDQAPADDSTAIVQQVVSDAATRVGVDATTVQVTRVEPRTWPDSSLGCPKPGFAYSQIVTPGFLVVVQAGGQSLEYHTGRGDQLELC